MLRAQSEISDIEKYKNNLNTQAQNAQAYQQQAYQQDIARRAAQNVASQQQQVQPQVTPEAEQWAQKNNWFMAEGYEDMTALAYGAHTQAVRSGVDVRSKNILITLITRLNRHSQITTGWIQAIRMAVARP